ncbi:hypothetical protein N0V90_003892 [Kalmusia sp. IMI 367209]|nr:hypothetical protein N0V90_003892 [Kalmusia sp. IMI 367209]
MDRALASIHVNRGLQKSMGSPTSIAHVNTRSCTQISTERPKYVSQGHRWDELHDIFTILWPGLSLIALMKVMEEDYGFRATKDQYKKKFREWYKRDMLPPKKRRKGDGASSSEEKPNELENMDTTNGAVVDADHRLPTPPSPPDHEETMAVIKEGALFANVDESYRPRSSTLGTPCQNKFHDLLSNLWNTYFDAEFGHADQITVGEAVRNMVEFILEVAATDPELSTITTHSGDTALLRRVAGLIRTRYPHEEAMWRRLEFAVSPDHSKSQQQRTRMTEDEWEEYYKNSAVPTLETLLRQPVGSRLNIGWINNTIVYCVSV